MLNSLTHHVKNTEVRTRVDALLGALLKESRSFIKENEQYIKTQDGAVKPSYKVRAGDTIYFSFERKEVENPVLVPENIPLHIIYEDEEILIIDKEKGMVVHPARGNWGGTLANAVAFHLQLQDPSELRPGIVHRLDKDTSGLIMVAKNRQAQKSLMDQLKSRTVVKIYTAIVAGYLGTTYGKIENFITRDPKNRLLYKVSPTDEGKYAVSEYQVVKELNKATLIKVRIHTGRTHQIRVHFKHLGNTLVGDKLYGSQFHHFPLCLHASKLIINHPVSGEKMVFEAPLPLEIENVAQILIKK